MRVSRNELLVLGALLGRERYGLEIVERVEHMNGTRLSLGGLYTMLHRMEQKGVVRGRWGDPLEQSYGARRRYYEITALGQQALAEAKRVLAPAFRLSKSGVTR
jgi:PadR family transcriptional regulator PadR